MSDFLNAYSIQRWLELAPQGYLEDTVYGHQADEKEPEPTVTRGHLRRRRVRSRHGATRSTAIRVSRTGT